MIPYDELKGCPFCGESNLEDIGVDTDCCVRCRNCGAVGPWASTIEVARRLWNNRKEEPHDDTTVPSPPTGASEEGQ